MEVVFDIGNVLLRWDPRNLYRSVFADEAALERFMSGPLASAFIIETDITPDFAAAVAARVRAFPEFAEELELFDTRWMETIGGPIEENVAILAPLKGERRPRSRAQQFRSRKIRADRRRLSVPADASTSP